MQRRRSTLTNNAAPSSSSAHYTAPRSRGNSGSALANNSAYANNNRDPNASPTAGIELRDRPSHGTSSSISRTFHRQPDVPSSSYAAPSYVPSPRPDDTLIIMKPVVSAVQAWSCVVISTFAIVILSILGLLFRNNHHEMVGGINDPENGPEVAATIFIAVLIYAGFLVFCGLQGVLHLRENRRGAIALQ